jgi:hypothetical protein
MARNHSQQASFSLTGYARWQNWRVREHIPTSIIPCHKSPGNPEGYFRGKRVSAPGRKAGLAAAAQVVVQGGPEEAGPHAGRQQRAPTHLPALQRAAGQVHLPSKFLMFDAGSCCPCCSEALLSARFHSIGEGSLALAAFAAA